MTDEPRPMIDRCRSSCRWAHCTGKGAHAHYSHACPFAPPPPPPPCNVCGEQAVDRYLPGWRCASCAPPSSSPTAVSSSPTRPPREYGTATDDPLGRTGPLNQYRLPTRGE